MSFYQITKALLSNRINANFINILTAIYLSNEHNKYIGVSISILLTF
jgi:hypothetical protein